MAHVLVVNDRSRCCRAGGSTPGFTLVELLIVIGIIGSLIGILMPVVAGARRESKKTACKAQLQQIGYAFRMYVDQNKDRYPRAPSLPSVNPNGYVPLVESIGTYVGNSKKVFECPADEMLFPAEGISYFYYSELGELPLRKTFFWKVYGDVTRVPILWDADHFHGGNVPLNWLFVDGHVERFLQQTGK